MSLGGGSDPDGSASSWRARIRRLAAAPLPAAIALAIGVAAFAGGVVATKVIEGPAAAAELTAGQPGKSMWAWFGKPRAAGAPRRGIAKPAGFAVWRTRVDVAGTVPKACVQMSRPLDPAKAYGDFISSPPSSTPSRR
jgi:hypothetical protein